MSSMGHLFVLSWARVRRVSRGSVVSESCAVSGMVFVTLLCCRLLRYVLTMLVWLQMTQPTSGGAVTAD